MNKLDNHSIDYNHVHDLWQKAHAAGSPIKFVRNTVVFRELNKLSKGRTLDAGCGQGEYSSHMALRGHQVTAFDPSSKVIEKIKPAADKTGFDVSVNTIESFTPKQSFDNIVCIEVLEHIKQDQEALIKLVSWLRPGGNIVLSIPASPLLFSEADRVSGHFRRYSGKMFKQLLKNAGLKDCKIVGYGFPVLFFYMALRKMFFDKAIIDKFDQPSSSMISKTGRLSQLYPYLMFFDQMNMPAGSVGYVARCKK